MKLWKRIILVFLIVIGVAAVGRLISFRIQEREGRGVMPPPSLSQENGHDIAPTERPSPAETVPPYVHVAPLTMADRRTSTSEEPEGEIVNELPVFRFTGGWNVEAWVYQGVSLTVEDVYGNIVVQDEHAEWKKHGNTTLRVAKNSYRFKLSEDVDLFGLGEEHNFILLANDFDRTMIRNSLALALADDLGLAYSSRSQFAEVYVDGVYKGCFLLVEPVQAGSERVDINEAQHEYLLEINPRDFFQFYTPIYEYSLVVKAPEKPADYELQWLSDFFTEAETAIDSGNRESIEQYLDLDSFLDSYLIYELFKNLDTNRFSTYFYIQDGKLFSGPVWDFDLSAGNVEVDKTAEGWIVEDGWWFTLMSNEWFQTLFAERLAMRQPEIIRLYRDTEEQKNRIDEIVASASGAFGRNYRIWDLKTRSYNIEIFPFPSYEENVEYLRQWLSDRNCWMLSELAPENSEELIRDARLEGGRDA